MPGRHITDRQKRLYMSFRQTEPPVIAAATSERHQIGMAGEIIPEFRVTSVGIHEGSTRSRETNGGCGTMRDVVEA